MASSELRTESTLNKIDKALSLWNDYPVLETFDVSPDVSGSNDQMLVEYLSPSIPMSKDHVFENFSSLFSNARSDEENSLLEAIVYSRIFDSFPEFSANQEQCKDESVWVRDVYLSLNEDAVLIRQGKIICHMSYVVLVDIRQKVKEVWAFLQDKVRANFVEAFASPECGQGSPDRVLQPPQAPPSMVTTSDPVRHPMTEEVKAIMLDELETLRVDARVKQQFAFDLKVLPEKGVVYWRDRLDCLRFSAASSPESQELQRLSQMVASFEKMMTREKPDETVLEEQASVLKSIEEVKENGKKLQKLVDTVGAEVKYNGDVLQKFMDTVGAAVKVNGEKLQELVQTVDAEFQVNGEKVQQLVKAVDPVKAIATDSKEILQQLVDSVVHEMAVNEEQLLKLVKSMDEKMKVTGENLGLLVATVDERLAVHEESRQQLEDCGATKERSIKDHMEILAYFEKKDNELGSDRGRISIWLLILYRDLIEVYSNIQKAMPTFGTDNRFHVLLNTLYSLNADIRILEKYPNLFKESLPQLWKRY